MGGGGTWEEGGVRDRPARTHRAMRRRCQSAVLISTCSSRMGGIAR